jgi:hypothetical protein
MSHTYAILDVSLSSYQEIHDKLEAAGYQDQFHGDRIDMHGIAVTGTVPSKEQIALVKILEKAKVHRDLSDFDVEMRRWWEIIDFAAKGLGNPSMADIDKIKAFS